MKQEKPRLPADPRFQGATPEQLAKALKKKADTGKNASHTKEVKP